MTAPDLFAEPLLSLPALRPRADTAQTWWQRWPWGLLQAAKVSVDVRTDGSAATWRLQAEAGQLLASALRLLSDMGAPPERRRAVARAVEVLRPGRAEVWLELREDGADLGWQMLGPATPAAVALLIGRDTPVDLCQAFVDAHGLQWQALGASIGGGYSLGQIDLRNAEGLPWPVLAEELGSLLGARLVIEPLPAGLADLPAQLTLGLRTRVGVPATGVVQPQVRVAASAEFLRSEAWRQLHAQLAPGLLAIAPEVPDTVTTGADRGRPSWQVGWGKIL